MEQFVNVALDLLVYFLTGVVISWYYYSVKGKALPGGFWGGTVIGIIGAVILTWLFGTWFIELLSWLMNPKQIYEDVYLRVNLIAAILGALLFVATLNRINHDQDRKRRG